MYTLVKFTHLSLIVFVNQICVVICAPAHTNHALSLCVLNVSAQAENILECNVQKGQILDYREVRNWSVSEMGNQYSVKIVCNGGKVHMPWPFKAKNIYSLEVVDCQIEGFLSEMKSVPNITDELTSLILNSVSIELPYKEMLDLTRHPEKIAWEADCGQTSLQMLVLRNIHYDLKVSPEERASIGRELFGRGIGEHGVHHNVQKPCVYRYLRYIDESGSRRTRQYHLKLLPENSQFPVLEYYNMSGNELGHIPSGFKNLHSKNFPALAHIDFSNNALRAFEFTFPSDLTGFSMEVIDLRHNLISFISRTTTDFLGKIGTLFVDLRENPLRCNCKLAAFRQFLQNQYQNTTDLKKRKLLSDITCTKGQFSPGKLKELSLLNASFGSNCVN